MFFKARQDLFLDPKSHNLFSYPGLSRPRIFPYLAWLVKYVITRIRTVLRPEKSLQSDLSDCYAPFL